MVVFASNQWAQQPFFNEWYVPGQTYIKLKTFEDGMYRISMADLQTAGVSNLGNMTPQNVQLFFRGVEVPVFVQGNGSGGVDYIDFLGWKNDGALDSLLYRDHLPPFKCNSKIQANANYSMFTDTAAFFLSWDASNNAAYQPVSAQNYSGWVPEISYRYFQRHNYKGAYFDGGGGSDDVFFHLNPDFTVGEGYCSGDVFVGASQDAVKVTFQTPGHVPNTRPTHVEGRVIGKTNASEHVLLFDFQLIPQLRDTTTGINVQTFAYDYNSPLAATSAVRMKALGNGNKPDVNTVTWWSLEYERNFKLNGSRSTVLKDWDKADTAFFRFTGADVNSEAWIFDPVRKEKIAAQVSGDTLRFLVPGHSSKRDLYLFTDRAIKTSIIESNTNLVNLSDVNQGAEFVILTTKDFANSANQYASYRANNPYNQLSTKVVYVDQVYDEFGYGAFLPYAIKNFFRYACTQWTVKPKHVMLWGKGRTQPRIDRRSDYVPILTYPPNDWEYVSNFSRDTVSLVPLAGLGRVSIQSDAEGLVYLAKVQDYESQEFDRYLKKAVFLGGGKNPSEYGSIGGTLIGQYLPIFESPPLNGTVYYFQKQSNGFRTNSDIPVEKRISQGAGIIQFFGHSAVNIFDIDILEPNRYTNFGKYPLMLAFGCSGGDYSQIIRSYGERSILEPGRGSIGYLGNSTSGFISILGSYGTRLYYQMMGDQYGRSIGELLQGTMQAFSDSAFASINIYSANQLKQMLLQGDPSVVLRLPARPDLRIDAADVYFPDGNPSSLAEEFQMNVIVSNDGRDFTDSFQVSIVQRMPNGQTVHFDTLKWASINTIDTLKFHLPNNAGIQSAGINRFTIRIDPLNDIVEELENNNEIVHEELFEGSLPAIIWPEKYAIVPDLKIKLKASTFTVTRNQVNYAFEIDTVHDFSSSFKKVSGPITGSSILGEWELPFDLEPEKVYYWRVRLQDYYPMQWNSGSFKYIPGKTGWAQSQFPQFEEDQLDGVIRSIVAREWEFDKLTSDLHSFIGSVGKPNYFLGVFQSEGYVNNGACFTSIDQYSLEPSIQDLPITGDWKFATAPDIYGQNGAPDVANAITTMKTGDYFLFSSNANANWPQWSDAVLRTFELVGVRYEQLRSLPANGRFLMLGRKGAIPGSAITVTTVNYVSNNTPFYDLKTTLTGLHKSGKIKSTRIGPSSKWSDIDFDWRTLDATVGDSMKVDVYGIRKDNSESKLLSGLASGIHTLANVDAKEFPNMRIEANASDYVHYTAPQIQNWEIYHQPAPEAAIDPNTMLQLPDTIIEGQIIELKVAGHNLSNFDMDSLLVNYYLQSADRQTILLGSKRLAPLPANQIRSFGITCATAGIGLKDGPATIIVEINPNNDQVEQYHFNNLFYYPVEVLTDKFGPIVNVAIDGRILMSGDIITPDPEIVIEVNDENAYLPVTVSDSTFRIWFGTERSFRLNPEIVISTDPKIEAGITRMPENKVRLTFKPGPLADGEYTLAIQGYDFKGNKATGDEYVIQMNVVNEKAISEVLPYPNPFSTSCRFVYTLTGNEKPYQFDIEIYTITGRLVKTIDLLATNDVHFGQNITTFAWDGRDEFGDLLANGTYIYRAKTRFQNKDEVQLRDEGISQYFNNGFGKLYIMR